MEEIWRKIENFSQKCSSLEESLSKIEGKMKNATDDELLFLETNNAKLKFRIKILERSIMEEEAYLKCTVLSYLEYLFIESIQTNYPNLEKIDPCLRISNFSDFQSNAALSMTKKLTQIGIDEKPMSIAQKIVENIPDNEIIDNCTVKNPGFINIMLKTEYINKKIIEFLKFGIKVNVAKKKRVFVDYSSPNIAKEMHVGHLRSTIIGDSLSNILEFLGHDVVRINHIGDWGTQFGMLLAHLTEKFPDFLMNIPPIGDLQEFYKEAKKRFDEDEVFKKKSYSCVVKLQSRDEQMYKAWKLICDISRKEFSEIYNILGIKQLIERGESFYQSYMEDMLQDLRSKGYLKVEDGRTLFFPKSASLVPLTLVKSDGGYTYDTSDLACIKHRCKEDKADWLIYVTDAGQANHFSSIFECAKIAGYYNPVKVKAQHVEFGLVLGQDGKKFKTRSGDTVRLKDLINEGFERAKAKLIQKERDKVLTSEELEAAIKCVTIGCIKYSDLAQDRVRDYTFSFDRMLDDNGNTAVYLLYNLVRIKSIIRKVVLDKSLDDIIEEKVNLDLSHPREMKLAKFIIRFPDVLLQIGKDLYPHSLCSYLFELSSIFSEFYEVCYCIEKSGDLTKVNIDRVLICKVVAQVLSKGLDLLGIQQIEKI